ncbi:MAG: carboxypeptidase-like regulatory domain-containing protein, partial [Gemmatimonadaceae bacterium]|nr:carboxypeptidase-like regulatory domain-containing protein [Gemmatimonadaceae bacterium]
MRTWRVVGVALAFAGATTSTSAQRARGDTAKAGVVPRVMVVSGVVQRLDGSPLHGAVIRVTRHYQSLVATTTSDGDGRFAFAAPPDALVRIEVDSPLSSRASSGLFVTRDMVELRVRMAGSRPTIDSTTVPTVLPVIGRVIDTTRAVRMSRQPDGTWQAVVPIDR